MDPEDTQEASPDPEVEIREAPLDPEEETREAPSDPEEETKDVAGPAAGSTDLGGPAIPVPRKLTISCNIPPNNVIATCDPRVRTGVEGAAPQTFLPTIKEVDEEGDEKSTSV